MAIQALLGPPLATLAASDTAPAPWPDGAAALALVSGTAAADPPPAEAA
jgi:hypothetical protein